MRKYGRKELNELFENFKAKDKKAIEEFLIFCGSSGGKTTLAKYRSVIIKICDTFGGDLDKITLPRLRKFLNDLNQSDLLPATKNEVRKVLKRFLKENYSDWSVRFKELKDIKGESEINQERINANTILRPEDIDALVRGARLNRDKALIMLFYETAGRPEEILKLKWKDINLDKGDVKLKSSKTGNLRINPIKNSVILLKRHKEEYPFSNVSADDLVFPSPNNRERQMIGSVVGVYIKRLGKRVLNRDIFLYLFRHSRATHLQKVLPAKIYEKFMDHSIETATRYSHLDKDDVREAMFDKVYSVEELSEEKKHELEQRIEELEKILGTFWAEDMKKMKSQKEKPKRIEN